MDSAGGRESGVGGRWSGVGTADDVQLEAGLEGIEAVKEYMGSATLKKKTELNYRRESAAHDCSECDCFVGTYHVYGIHGQYLRTEARCMVMGLKAGRAYRIHPKNICDAHDNSEMLKRLPTDS